MQIASLSKVGFSLLIDNLKAYMKERGWDQYDLARVADVAPSTISKILTGRTKSSGAAVLQKLAKALDVDVSDLLGRDEDEVQIGKRGLVRVHVNLSVSKKLSEDDHLYLDDLISKMEARLLERLDAESGGSI